MSETNRRAKDQEMAARMKREGTERRTMRCPMCHNVVPRKRFDSHLGKCTAR